MSPRRAQVICMASVKGGSGKTVLAATFGAILSEIGKRVLLVDTDAATNGLSLFYLNEVVNRRDALRGRAPEAPAGTYELSEDPHRVPTLVKLNERLALLPATYRFFDSETAEVPAYTASLRAATRTWRSEFDYIFLDAQAGSDGFAHGAMRKDVSDKVILVSEYDPLSAAGVERLKALFSEDLSYERIWILLSKMLPDIATRYGEFLEVARYLPPVPWSAEVVRAYSRRSLALDLHHGNAHTVAACQTLAALVDEDTARELRIWLGDKAAELRLPVAVQISDLRSELRATSSRSDQRERRESFRLNLLAGGLTAFVMAFLLGLLSEATTSMTLVAAMIGAGGALVLGMFLLRRSMAKSRSETAPQREAEIRERLSSLEALTNLSDPELLSRGGIRDEAKHPFDPGSDG